MGSRRCTFHENAILVITNSRGNACHFNFADGKTEAQRIRRKVGSSLSRDLNRGLSEEKAFRFALCQATSSATGLEACMQPHRKT